MLRDREATDRLRIGELGDVVDRLGPSGMVRLQLDLRGRLVDLLAVPPQRDPAPETAPPEPDWDALIVASAPDCVMILGADNRSVLPFWRRACSVMANSGLVRRPSCCKASIIFRSSASMQAFCA